MAAQPRPLPIACELTPEQLAARRSSLLSELVRRSTECVPTATGYRLRFPADRESVALVVAAIEAERHCCRFLRFVLTVEQDLGPVTLELDGPEGTREFLASILEPDRS